MLCVWFVSDLWRSSSPPSPPSSPCGGKSVHFWALPFASPALLSVSGSAGRPPLHASSHTVHTDLHLTEDMAEHKQTEQCWCRFMLWKNVSHWASTLSTLTNFYFSPQSWSREARCNIPCNNFQPHFVPSKFSSQLWNKKETHWRRVSWWRPVVQFFQSPCWRMRHDVSPVQLGSRRPPPAEKIINIKHKKT